VATINFDHQMMASESSRSGLFTTIVGTTGASAHWLPRGPKRRDGSGPFSATIAAT